VTVPEPPALLIPWKIVAALAPKIESF